MPLAVYDDHGQAATFYYPFAQSGRRQVDARSAELGLLARPQATAKASGGGAKRGAVGEEGKGAAVEDTSKEAKVNLTEYFARYELTRIRREWHDQFEAIAQDVVDIFKVCTKLPEEWHHELKSIAKSLVDVFVIMVHAGEEMGVRT